MKSPPKASPFTASSSGSICRRPTKCTAPRYQDLAGDAVPVRRQPGVEVRVFSGASGGVTAPTKNFVPVTMVEVRLDPGASVRQDLPADYNAVIVLLEGEGSIGAEAKFATAGDVAWLTRADSGEASEVAVQRRTNHCALCSMPVVHCMRQSSRAVLLS